MKKERRLMVFEYRVLRGIFGANRNGVTGEWIKLHRDELNDLHWSTSVVLLMKWKNELGGACSDYDGY